MLKRISQTPLVRIVFKRVLHSIPVMFGVSFITFTLMNLLPGDAATALLGEGATPSQVKALEFKLHLNEPFFERYWHWLGGLLSGHPGNSIATGQTITSMFGQRLPVTFELGLLALLLAVVFSIIVAVLAASRANGIVDKISVTLSMIGLSIPNFVIGLVLIFLFAVHLRLVPSSGFVPLSTSVWLNLKSMILPATTIAFGLFASFTRILRGDLVDQLVGSDHIMFARSKGLSPRRILVSHALRNSMFGYLTIVALNLGTLLGGAVLVEQIFALPGIGQELVQSITYHDSTVVESVVVILSVTVVVANLLTDLLYSILDPRIRDGRRA